MVKDYEQNYEKSEEEFMSYLYVHMTLLERIYATTHLRIYA